jgi:uncharacterized membrane protein (DUF2068 family)
LPSWLSNIWTLVVFAGVIAVAAAGIVASRRHEGQHRRSSDALWDELRRAHDLSRRQVRLLRRASEKAGLEPTNLIFVEPHVLMRLADERPESRDDLHDLMTRLYS